MAARRRVKSQAVTPGPEHCLITGGGGVLATMLQAELMSRRAILVSAKVREILDVTDGNKAYATLSSAQPDIVVHCAAMTDTEQAENSEEAAWRVNAYGTGVIAGVCADLNIPFVLISSDWVFDRGWYLPPVVPFCEDDVAGPSSSYGASKLAAEHIVLVHRLHKPAWPCWIVRTAGLFSLADYDQSSFARKLLVKLRQIGREIPVVQDVTTNICATEELVTAIGWLVEQISRKDGAKRTCPPGVYHVVNQGAASWYDIADRMLSRLPAIARSSIVRVSRAQYWRHRGTDAYGPVYSALDPGKFLALPSAPPLATWQTAIDRWCQAIVESEEL